MGKIIYTAIIFALLAGVVFLINFLSTQNNKIVAQNNDTIKIITSILPQVDFVSRIGGDKVQVSEMIPPGFSPTSYDPSPAQLKKLQEAQLYIKIGYIPFENAQMNRLALINDKMVIVDSSKGVKLLNITAHSHGTSEDPSNGEETGIDPHIWLSPKQVKIQAKNIYEAFIAFKPEFSKEFTINYENFLNDLDELDGELERAFLPIQGKTILVFHPAFGYLADAYGFYQEAIEIEGKDPSPAQLKEIIDEAKKDGINVIFVQAQFNDKSAKTIASEINGVVVRLDPLAPNYFDNMKKMADTIIYELK
ncbi:MAG: zinc ABC transporter substrate-binding protein [bacterium]